MELIMLIVWCCLATVSSITTSTSTVSTSTLNSTSSTMLQSNDNSSENTTLTSNTTSVTTTSPTNTSETINSTTLPSSSQSSTSTPLTTTHTSNTISPTFGNSSEGSSSVVTTTQSPTTSQTQTSTTTSIISSPSPESTLITSPAQTSTSTTVTTLPQTTSSTATTATQTSIPTIPTTLPTTTKTSPLTTPFSPATSSVFSMNVTEVNSHFAYFEFTSTLLQSFFACLCGNSYQCRIPLTYRQGSNYNFDIGNVEQSRLSSSNENFVCRIEDLGLTQYNTALNCSRGQSSCYNCGHFNFTSSQCSGQSTQVKWVSTQSVKLGYNRNIVNIVCDSSNVQCDQRNDFTDTPPPAFSGTTTTTSGKPSAGAITQAGETGNTGLILGLVFGFLVLAVIVAMVIVWRKQRNDKMRGSTVFDDESTRAHFTNGSTNDYVTSSTSTAKANNARPYVNIGIKDGRNGSGISGEYNAGYQNVELLAHPGPGNGKAPTHPPDPGLKTNPDLNFNQTDELDGEDDSDSSWSDESNQGDDTEPNNEYSRLGNIAVKQNLNDYGAANSPSSNYNVTATPTSGQQSRDLPHPPLQVIELSNPGVKLKNDYDYPTVSSPRESKIYNEVDEEEDEGAHRNSEIYTSINETQLPEPESKGGNYNPYFELDIDSMYGSKGGT